MAKEVVGQEAVDWSSVSSWRMARAGTGVEVGTGAGSEGAGFGVEKGTISKGPAPHQREESVGLDVKCM